MPVCEPLLVQELDQATGVALLSALLLQLASTWFTPSATYTCNDLFINRMRFVMTVRVNDDNHLDNTYHNSYDDELWAHSSIAWLILFSVVYTFCNSGQILVGKMLTVEANFSDQNYCNFTIADCKMSQIFNISVNNNETKWNYFSRPMPFCTEGAKRHW